MHGSGRVLISESVSTTEETAATPVAGIDTDQLAREFGEVLDKMAQARTYAKARHQPRLFAITMKLLRAPGGVAALYRHAPKFDESGLFVGGDWDFPERLQPDLVRETLLQGGNNVTVECLSQLRMLAIANGDVVHPELLAAQAAHFLEAVIARNLDILYPEATESSRGQAGALGAVRE